MNKNKLEYLSHNNIEKLNSAKNLIGSLNFDNNN
jgi:hypothetical protein